MKYNVFRSMTDWLIKEKEGIIRVLTVALYFFLAIIFFGSFGVTIPYLFESIKGLEHSIIDLNQNIVTYYIAIFSCACLDFILKLIDKDSPYKKAKLLFLTTFCILVFTGTAFILYLNTNGYSGKIYWWLVLGVVISYIMWVVVHFKDDAFNPTSTLGGDPSRSLNNG